MAPELLDVLKKGLNTLVKQTGSQKERLKADLCEKKRISAVDKAWLDNDANLVEERALIEVLSSAGDLDEHLKTLGKEELEIVEQLRIAARDLSKVAGAKRKRPEEKPKKNAEKNRSEHIPRFTKKENATLAQRIEILGWHFANGANQSRTAKHFNAVYPNLKLKQPLLSAWVKDRAKWESMWAQAGSVGMPAICTAKRVQQTQHPVVTDMMDLWVLKAMEDGIQLMGEVLRQKWTSFADIACIPEDERLNLGDGWLASFKSRHGLKEFKRHGEAASADEASMEQERKRLHSFIKSSGYAMKDVFNMDETGLFYAMPPNRGLADHHCSGVKGEKVRLTLTLTTNATGSEKLPPLIIGKAFKPHAFGKKTGGQLGFYYRNNAKAWVTTIIYQEWL